MKTIIELAREAGFQSAEFWPDDFKGLHGCVERFAALVREAERERCAQVAVDAVAFNGGTVQMEAHVRTAIWGEK